MARGVDADREGMFRMTMKREVSRRTFLVQGAIGLGGVGLLAACAPSSPASKPAETKPADAAKPAAGATRSCAPRSVTSSPSSIP